MQSQRPTGIDVRKSTIPLTPEQCHALDRIKGLDAPRSFWAVSLPRHLGAQAAHEVLGPGEVRSSSDQHVDPALESRPNDLVMKEPPARHDHRDRIAGLLHRDRVERTVRHKAIDADIEALLLQALSVDADIASTPITDRLHNLHGQCKRSRSRRRQRERLEVTTIKRTIEHDRSARQSALRVGL